MLDSISQSTGMPVWCVGFLFIVGLFLLLWVLLLICSCVGNRKRKVMLLEGENLLWKDRKHTFLGLPWSFTVYSLDGERLYVKVGLFSTVENEVRLYRILDVQLKRTLKQRLLGLGSIILVSSDKSMGNFELLNVCQPRKVKELISENVEKQRKENRVAPREVMHEGFDDGDGFECDSSGSDDDDSIA